MSEVIRGGVRRLTELSALTLDTQGNDRAEVIDVVGAAHTITGLINGAEQTITFDGNVGSYVLLLSSRAGDVGWLLAVGNGVTIA